MRKVVNRSWRRPQPQRRTPGFAEIYDVLLPGEPAAACRCWVLRMAGRDRRQYALHLCPAGRVPCSPVFVGGQRLRPRARLHADACLKSQLRQGPLRASQKPCGHGQPLFFRAHYQSVLSREILSAPASTCGSFSRVYRRSRGTLPCTPRPFESPQLSLKSSRTVAGRRLPTTGSTAICSRNRPSSTGRSAVVASVPIATCR